MAKTFHVYTEKGRKGRLPATEKFYVLDYFNGSYGPCGSTERGFRCFKHMLEALESHLEYLLEFTDDENVDGNMLLRKMKRIESAMARIKQSGTDQGEKCAALRFSGPCFEYRTDACGYWAEFVPKALTIFKKPFQQEIQRLDCHPKGNPERAVEEINRLLAWIEKENGQKEPDEGMAALKRKVENIQWSFTRRIYLQDRVKQIEILKQRKDITAPDFVKLFLEMAKDYGDWE